MMKATRRFPLVKCSGYLRFLLLLLLLHLAGLFWRLEEKQDSKLRAEVKKESHILKLFLHKEHQQIVQSEDPESDKTVDEKEVEAFLSDKKRRVERETQARKIDPFRAQKKDLKLSELGALPQHAHPYQWHNEALAQAQVPQESQEETSVQSSTSDYLEDIPLGDVTELNTNEYRYFGFYQRIREKLEQFWGRSIQEKAEMILGEGRTLLAGEDHLTTVRVVMDAQGRILAVKVLTSSGVQELDEAAVESFNESGPFPHPPKGLIQQGLVIIEWGFVVKT